MHGGTYPGAPKDNRNACEHGGRSAEAEGAARYLREVARLVGLERDRDKSCRWETAQLQP